MAKQPEFTVVSDASGSWGCGAIWGARWFQVQWENFLPEAHIAIKESVPLVIATAIWGGAWKGKSVRMLTDNSAVVAAINSNSSRVPEMAHLLRCLTFYFGLQTMRNFSSSHTGFT